MSSLYFERFTRDRDAQERVWRNFLSLMGTVELGWVQADLKELNSFDFENLEHQ